MKSHSVCLLKSVLLSVLPAQETIPLTNSLVQEEIGSESSLICSAKNNINNNNKAAHN